MRGSIRKRLGFGLILIWIALTVLRMWPKVAPSIGVGPSSLDGVQEARTALFSPRGAKTVAIVFAAALVAALAGFGWTEARQQALMRTSAKALTGGEPDHAPALLVRYGCGGCHTISGAAGADGQVGPSLVGLRQRVYVGGVLQNTPANLVRWIVDPQSVSPHSAMPATGITDAEARDVAAYLYAQ